MNTWLEQLRKKGEPARSAPQRKAAARKRS
jgi:hypothetical protein